MSVGNTSLPNPARTRSFRPAPNSSRTLRAGARTPAPHRRAPSAASALTGSTRQTTSTTSARPARPSRALTGLDSRLVRDFPLDSADFRRQNPRVEKGSRTRPAVRSRVVEAGPASRDGMSSPGPRIGPGVRIRVRTKAFRAQSEGTRVPAGGGARAIGWTQLLLSGFTPW